MARADWLKLLLAALVAYFTATVKVESRLTVQETNRTNDRQLLQKLDEKIDDLTEKLFEVSADVRVLKERKP